MNLSDFRENPDNPSTATAEEIERLAGKLRRVPLGLVAMRIAYVTDADGGGKMVISGNKRLRCLKAAYGESGEVPDDWFADVTAMSEAERHEFILDANISDGHWDLERLLAQYGEGELANAMGEDAAAKLLEDINLTAEESHQGGLAEKFGVAPFSVLDARQGTWQERKAAWLALGLRSVLGRGGGKLETQGSIARQRSYSTKKRTAKVLHSTGLCSGKGGTNEQ